MLDMGKRRAKREGHVRQRPDGTWESRLYVPKHLRPLYGGKREISFYSKNQDAVLEKRAAAKRDMDSGFGQSKSGTLGDYLARWLDALDSLGTVSRRTASDHRYYSEKHLIPRLGAMKLSELTVEDFDSLYSALSRDGVGVRTINHVHATARAALNRAVKKRLIPYNPAKDADVPKYSTDHREYRTLPWPEIAEFFEAIRGDRYEAFFVVAALSGVRPQELQALSWEDVDFERGELTIRRAVEEIRGQQPAIRNTTKTRKPRIVPLLPEAASSLKSHRAAQNEERMAKAGLWKDRGLVFPDALGGITRRGNIARRHFKPALEKARLPKDVRAYDLRHSFATLFLESGERVETLAGILGHARITTTLERYIHPDDRARKDAMGRFGRSLGG